MTVCVIPARGGSQRIPGKNTREFLGRPMIEWSIEAARAADCFDRIVVSTDDDHVASVAEAAGAEVPFRREAELADDFTPTRPVVADAAEQLQVCPETPICCLYATAPFVQGVDLARGLALLNGQDARYVISVASFPFPIQRALRRSEVGAIEMIEPAHMSTRSQDLEEAWHDAGQFYWAKARVWKDAKADIFSSGAFGMPLPRHRVQDIDNEEDWTHAEFLMSALLSRARGTLE